MMGSTLPIVFSGLAPNAFRASLSDLETYESLRFY